MKIRSVVPLGTLYIMSIHILNETFSSNYFLFKFSQFQHEIVNGVNVIIFTIISYKIGITKAKNLTCFVYHYLKSSCVFVLLQIFTLTETIPLQYVNILVYPSLFSHFLAHKSYLIFSVPMMYVHFYAITFHVELPIH